MHLGRISWAGLRCLLAIYIKMVERPMNIWIWSSGEKISLEIELWKSSAYQWYVKPWNWIKSLMELVVPSGIENSRWVNINSHDVGESSQGHWKEVAKEIEGNQSKRFCWKVCERKECVSSRKICGRLFQMLLDGA